MSLDRDPDGAYPRVRRALAAWMAGRAARS
jgi:hypothetical protein